MFERLQKPFLTVETGEAYQPIRVGFEIYQRDKLIELLGSLACCEKTLNANTWNWSWQGECEDLHFESLDTYKKNLTHPPRLGTLSIRNNYLFINLPSFKRACMAVPFFSRLLNKTVAQARTADFLNKVFAIDERVSHGFSELLKEEELERLVHQRAEEYEKVQALCEKAATAEEAFTILSEYTKRETQKRLPYAERYDFELNKGQNTDAEYLGFYIFLRSRELIAIRRWLGETGYTLSNVADETIEKVFGGMDLDIID